MRSSPYLLILSRVATLLLTVVTTTLVARSIGPTGRGLTGAGTALAALLPVVAAWGIPTLVRQRAAAGNWESVLRSARRLSYLMVLPMGLIGWGFAAAFMSELTDIAMILFVLLAASAGLYAHAIAGLSVLIVQGRYLAVAVLQALQISIAFVGLVSLHFVADITVAGVFACQGLGTVSTWLFGLMVLKARRVRGEGVVRSVSRGSRYLVSSVLDAASLRLDQVLVLPVVGSTQAGYHSVAIAVGTPLLALGHAVGTASFRQVAQGGKDSRDLARSFVRGAFAIALVCSLPAAFMMPLLVPLVFGEEFRPAVVPAILICLAGPALVANFVAGQAFAALERPGQLTLMCGLIVGSVSGGLVVFGVAFGAVGTATAFMGGQFLGTVYAWLSLKPEQVRGRAHLRADVRLVLKTLRHG